MAARSEIILESAGIGEEARARARRPGAMKALIAQPTGLAGLAIVVTMGLVALGAPLLAPADPAAVDAAQRLLPPSLAHPFGTDNLGRDVLSRIVWGARLSLGTATLATALILTIGVGLGLVAGYAGGLVDDLVMRVVDVLLAFPALVLALAIVGTLGPGAASVIVGLVATAWAGHARITRGLVLAARERAYVEAARAVGASHARVIVVHLLPNVLSPVVVLASLEMGAVVLAVAALSFLGLGAQPPAPEWGAMLNDGRPFIQSAPQLMVYPGAAISLVVVGFNLLGDAIRDAFDPYLRR